MGAEAKTDTASRRPLNSYVRRAADVTWLLLSFGLRLAAGMVVLILLARLLGRESFGQFAYCLAMATLFAVSANFGLTTFVLREVGIDRQRFAATMGEALTTKLVISCALLAAGGVMACLLQPELRLPFALLLAAQLIESFAELFNLGFRPKGLYQDEARTAVATSSLHLVLMGSVTLLAEPNAAVAAGLFCLSRMLGCAWIWRQTRRLEAPIRPAKLAAVPALVRRSWAYAFELFQFTAYAQMDSVLIKHHLGIIEVGLYQAGMKLVEGGARLAPVLAQYALPTLTQKLQSRQKSSASFRMFGVFALIGGGGALCLTFGADYIANSLYGSQYAALHSLLPMFGLMLLLRYLETAGGILVVAAGLQHVKVWLVSVQLLLTVFFGSWAMERWGLPGWQWVVVITLALAVVANLALVGVSRLTTARRQSGGNF